MADQVRRIEAYKIKTTPERIKEVVEARLESMRARYEKAMQELFELEMAIKEVLNESGVSTSFYVPYLNYGRQLYKLRRQQIAGESLKLAARVLLDKWGARGLNMEILALIRSRVFGIEEPSV